MVGKVSVFQPLAHPKKPRLIDRGKQMSKKLGYLLALVALSFLLCSCNQDSEYRDLMTHSSKLQQRLTHCQHSTTLSCQNARQVAYVLNEYISLERVHGPALLADRHRLMQLQTASTPTAVAERERLMNRFATVETGIQEQFGEKIMLAESHLAQLKQQLTQAKTNKERKTQRIKIKQQQRLIRVMWTLIRLNEAE
jgi:hypothetical protein